MFLLHSVNIVCSFVDANANDIAKFLDFSQIKGLISMTFRGFVDLTLKVPVTAIDALPHFEIG